MLTFLILTIMLYHSNIYYINTFKIVLLYFTTGNKFLSIKHLLMITI